MKPSLPRTVVVHEDDYVACVALAQEYLALIHACRSGEATGVELAARVHAVQPIHWPEGQRRLYATFVKKRYPRKPTQES